jgi:tRNA pseudouridine13 synthase
MAERALGPPCGRGRIRVVDEDFRVVEQLGYAPSGEGEHLWLEIEKRDHNTLDVARFLADQAGVPLRNVGFAGLKDRHAVTRQPFTIHLAGRADPDWSAWQVPGIRVLSGARHRRKIQRGRLAGNRFELVVRDFEGDRDRLAERLAQIAAGGVPNRFGEQRFGGNNIARAHRMFRGELQRAPSRAKRGFYLSAARSLIFNRVLDERIRRGDWNRVIDGDVLNLDGSRSRFAAGDDPALPARVEALDLHPTGPLFGVGALESSGTAAAIEQAEIERERELADGLLRFGTAMDRRPLRMRVGTIEASWGPDGSLELAFALPAGSFATTVLAELLEYEDASRDNTES